MSQHNPRADKAVASARALMASGATKRLACRVAGDKHHVPWQTIHGRLAKEAYTRPPRPIRGTRLEVTPAQAEVITRLADSLLLKGARAGAVLAPLQARLREIAALGLEAAE